MKKIILYGIANRALRMKVKSYIGDKYEIIGVSDSKWTEDYLQGECYISPNEIVNAQFDYILVVTSNELFQDEIIKMLEDQGIHRDKIIIPRLLYQKDAEYIPDLKRDMEEEIESNKQADSLCLGLSYSLRGIDFKKLQLNCIDCSWHGLDLYYCYKVQQLFRGGSRYKTALLVFPYYYFNYDMSLSEYQFKTGQILACRGFRDWHNANKQHNFVINDYMVSEALFGERFWMNKRWKKEIPREHKIIENTSVEIAEIWKRKYEDTIKENGVIFSELIKSLNGMRIIIVVPPMFWGVIKETDATYIRKQKELFYSMIDSNRHEGVIEFYDCSEMLQKREYFYDYEHLNEVGREAFTKLLNEKLGME